MYIKSQVYVACIWQPDKEMYHSVTANSVIGSYELRFHGYFCLRVIGENGGCFGFAFLNMEILPNDISNFEIERMIK
jgi:hypothetical protein